MQVSRGLQAAVWKHVSNKPWWTFPKHGITSHLCTWELRQAWGFWSVFWATTVLFSVEKDIRISCYYFFLSFSISSPEKSKQVLQEVGQTIKSFPFKFQGAKILSGKEEGAYGWVTVNYLLENFIKVHLIVRNSIHGYCASLCFVSNCSHMCNQCPLVV